MADQIEPRIKMTDVIELADKLEPIITAHTNSAELAAHAFYLVMYRLGYYAAPAVLVEVETPAQNNSQLKPPTKKEWTN